MNRRLLRPEEIAANEIGARERTIALMRVYATKGYDDETLEKIAGNESGEESLDAIEAAKQVVHERIERGEYDMEGEMIDGYRRPAENRITDDLELAEDIRDLMMDGELVFEHGVKVTDEREHGFFAVVRSDGTDRPYETAEDAIVAAREAVKEAR